MSKPAFSIPAADLERGPKTLTASLPNAWLRLILADTHAEPQGDGSLDVELMKTGRSVMVRGKASARVTVPCVVTLDPLPFELSPEIFLLLSPSEGSQRSQTARKNPDKRGESDRKRPKNAGMTATTRTSSSAKTTPPRTPSTGRTSCSTGSSASSWCSNCRSILAEPTCLPSQHPLTLRLPQRAEAEAPVDPRLQPLAEIAKRLGEQKKE